jgi:ATP-dependent DNA helicase RecQ
LSNFRYQVTGKNEKPGNLIPMSANKELTNYLQKYFGYDRFKGEQEEAIQSVLDGNNTFILMPTGAGKSLIYQFPALIMEGTAIVISPLIALMKNQVDSMRGI